VNYMARRPGELDQLGGIDGHTLRAPPGEHDDRADAYALACVGRRHARTRGCYSWDDVFTLGAGCPAAIGYYGGYETALDQRQRLRAQQKAMEESRLPPGQMTFTPDPRYVEPKFP
jgi:hypothetical protein